MCIFVLALDASEEFPTVLFFNRDEEFRRPTDPLKVEEEREEVTRSGITCCARDGKAGGTWMGLSGVRTNCGESNFTAWKFACLTNVRHRLPAPVTAPGEVTPSRGKLVMDAISTEGAIVRDRRGDTADANPGSGNNDCVAYNLLDGCIDPETGRANVTFRANIPTTNESSSSEESSVADSSEISSKNSSKRKRYDGDREDTCSARQFSKPLGQHWATTAPVMARGPGIWVKSNESDGTFSSNHQVKASRQASRALGDDDANHTIVAQADTAVNANVACDWPKVATTRSRVEQLFRDRAQSDSATGALAIGEEGARCLLADLASAMSVSLPRDDAKCVRAAAAAVQQYSPLPEALEVALHSGPFLQPMCTALLAAGNRGAARRRGGSSGSGDPQCGAEDVLVPTATQEGRRGEHREEGRGGAAHSKKAKTNTSGRGASNADSFSPVLDTSQDLDYDYGTVSQSAIITCASERAVFYAYRETHKPKKKKTHVAPPVTSGAHHYDEARRNASQHLCALGEWTWLRFPL